MLFSDVQHLGFDLSARCNVLGAQVVDDVVYGTWERYQEEGTLDFIRFKDCFRGFRNRVCRGCAALRHPCPELIELVDVLAEIIAISIAKIGK